MEAHMLTLLCLSLESHSMHPSEVSTFPRVLDGGAHAGLAMHQLESHSMRPSEVNTFPRVLDGGAHADITVPHFRVP